MERSTSVQFQMEEATPVISQGLENMSVQGEETLQINTDPTELDDGMECCNSSATESAPSDDEDISAFNMYEVEKSLMDDENDKPVTKPALIKTTAPVHCRDLHTMRVLELNAGEQSGSSEPNTEIAVEMKIGLNTEEEYKCYMMVANVFKYLRYEFESTKLQLKGVLGFNKLRDIYGRTAAATGVPRELVRFALQGVDLRVSHEDYSHNNEDLSGESDSEVERNAKIRRVIIRNRAKRDRSRYGQSTSKKKLAMRRAPSRKRRSNSVGDDFISDDERVLPTKRRATRDIVVTNSGNERQLPFSASMQLIIDEARKPECEIELDHDEMLIVHNESLTVDNHLPDQKPLTIDDDPLDEESLNIDDDSVEKEFPALVQLRVVGVMEPGLKLDMSDDEEPMSDNDPLKAEAWFRYHCERATRSEATGTVSKTEPTNDDNLKVSKLDSLEQDNQEALE